MKRTPLLPDRPRPLFFAHRGCSSLAPENTMASFHLAREQGSPGLELDIHRCASGELVVAHDDDFKRCAGSLLRIEETEWQDIKHIDIGSYKGNQFAGEKVPLIQDILDEFSDKLYIDVELKSRKSSGDDLPASFARLLHERSDAKKLASSIVISSFNPLALAAFKEEAPEFATAIIWCDDEELPWYLHQGQGRWLSGCDYLKPIKKKATRLSLALLDKIGGRPLVPWTVDDVAEAQVLIERGCQGVISNRPQDLLPIAPFSASRLS